MPGDPLKHVVTGEKFQPQARTWNTFVDTSKWVQSRQIAIDRGLIRDSETPGIILVKNESGSTLERFAAVGLDEPIILPSASQQGFLEKLAFRAVAAGNEHTGGRWALLLEPLAGGKIGRAATSGTFPAKLTVGAGDEYSFGVDASAASTWPIVTASGPATVLWKESGVGTKWGVIRFGDDAPAVYRLDTYSIRGVLADGIRQERGGGTWQDADTNAVTLEKNFSWGYHAPDDLVEVRKIGPILEIVSNGAPKIRGVLNGNLVSGGTAEVTIYDSSWTTTGEVITGVPAWSGTLDSTIASGTRVSVIEVNGDWAVDGEIC